MNRRIVAAVLLAAAAGSALAQDKVLRVVPHSNLSILDPIWTTAYMSRNHGYMIYDTLFGTDEKSQIKPQMVEQWSSSPDRRLWTFKLRKGLEFHDGNPVTSEDVTASLARWGKRDEFKPGDKAVYLRNTKYVPRKEPPSGSTGGKHVYVDRVEWNLALRDAQAQVNALVNGEVDILEQPSFPLIPGLQKDPNIVVYNYSPVPLQYMARFNHLHKPFDNAKVRQAAMAAFAQLPFLQAQVGVKELYKTCPSMFTCGTPYASSFGTDIQSKSNMKKAQELLKASGYDGTPVVLMKPTDLAAIDKLPDVAAQLMRQAGFKVDLQAMDWQTLVGRRAKKDAPDKGGWNMFLTAWQGPDIWNPIANAALDTRGEQSGWFGWGKDDRIVELRNQFMRETDESKKKKLAEAIQARAFEVATHVPLGEFDAPLAARKNVTGLFRQTGNFYWNLKKN